MSEYVCLFQGIEIQIPASDMMLGDHKHRFLSSLPTELAMQLMQLKQTATVEPFTVQVAHFDSVAAYNPHYLATLLAGSCTDVAWRTDGS